MIRHITYTDQNMTISAAKCGDSALDFGCDSSRIYMQPMLDRDFLIRNIQTLSLPRGAGYWIWKPQIILQEFEHAQDGDYVIYTDAGIEFIRPVQLLINEMDEFCMLFGNQYKHHEWCKGDVLKPEHIGKNQLQASAMIFKVCPESVEFLHEWRNMCEVHGMITDAPSTKPNHPNFSEHRHDQAILTTLQLSQGIKSHYWPANYLDGKFEYPRLNHKDTYPVIFHHHRKRNDEWI
jgi:hypothetical protein